MVLGLIYFSTLAVRAQLAHQYARSLPYPGRPEWGEIKFVSPECLAYFKLFGMQEGRKSKRFLQDLNDLQLLITLNDFDFKRVDDHLTSVFGEDSYQHRVLRSLQRGGIRVAGYLGIGFGK